MGYDTRYKLTAVYFGEATPAAVIRSFVSNNEEAGYCLEEDGAPANSGRWCEHENDLLALSKEHPHLLFTLEGEGAENGDLWKKYFQGGRVQIEKAEIAIAPFDPAKLKVVRPC